MINIHLHRLFIAGLIFGFSLACQKKDQEATSEENTLAASDATFNYHMQPFNYTVDEGDHLTGVCFAFTEEAYEQFPALRNNGLLPGDCDDQVDIPEYPNSANLIGNSVVKTCLPYANEGQAYARVKVYNVSYQRSNQASYETSLEEAEALCSGLETFADLIAKGN
ncbi:MAG: hypothetical protein ACOH5I_02980 [Oligoflexus sp.]